MRRLLLAALLACDALSSSEPRRKRSLTFPKGSAFVLTITMLKAIQLKEPANWNLDLEFDMIWPIPSGVNGPRPQRRRPHYHGWQQPHRRHRRELYANFELALDRQGLPGKLCILRGICEAKFILNPPGVSLLEDLLRVVFSYPSGSEHDAYDIANGIDKDCDALFPCPFSVLDLLLNFHHDVSEYA